VSKRYGESPDKEKKGVKEVRGTPRQREKTALKRCEERPIIRKKALEK